MIQRDPQLTDDDIRRFFRGEPVPSFEHPEFRRRAEEFLDREHLSDHDVTELLEESTHDSRLALLSQHLQNCDACGRRFDELSEAHLDSDRAALDEWTQPRPGPFRVDQRVAHYTILEELGRGGFGVVYLARQAAPIARQVAIKALRWEKQSDDILARFHQEQVTVGLFDHANIAKGLDSGTSPEGVPYLVLEYVDGPPIDEYADREHLSVPERIRLFLRVARAIHYAHQKGVIHRDLKPANILVTQSVDAGAEPKLIDFGIAKLAIEALRTSHTGRHDILGTRDYAAPEQISAPSKADVRSDIYSLGVVLYQLLTGELLFPTDSESDATPQPTVDRDPPRPSETLRKRRTSAVRGARPASDYDRFAPFVSGDLDWIVIKCLQHDPRMRYQDVGQLVEDLENHLALRPVRARPPSVVYRGLRFVRRNRGRVASTTLILAVVLTSAFLLITSAARNARFSNRTRAREFVKEIPLVYVTDPEQAQSLATEALKLDPDRRDAEIWKALTMPTARSLASIKSRLLELPHDSEIAIVLGAVNLLASSESNVEPSEVLDDQSQARIYYWAALLSTRLGPEQNEWAISALRLARRWHPSPEVNLLLIQRLLDSVNGLSSLGDQELEEVQKRLRLATNAIADVAPTVFGDRRSWVFSRLQEVLQAQFEAYRKFLSSDSRADANHSIQESVLWGISADVASATLLVQHLKDFPSGEALPSAVDEVLRLARVGLDRPETAEQARALSLCDENARNFRLAFGPTAAALRRAQKLLREGNYSEFRTKVEKAASLDPATPRFLRFMAAHFAGETRFDLVPTESLTLFELGLAWTACAEDDPSAATELVTSSLSREAPSDADRGIKRLFEALAGTPDIPVAEAIETIVAEEIFESTEILLNVMAAAHALREGDKRAAEQRCRRALNLLYLQSEDPRTQFEYHLARRTLARLRDA
ncbi:MAG: serine/threonine-protein kinase [Planctomycetota bacterium]